MDQSSRQNADGQERHGLILPPLSVAQEADWRLSLVDNIAGIRELIFPAGIRLAEAKPQAMAVGLSQWQRGGCCYEVFAFQLKDVDLGFDDSRWAHKWLNDVRERKWCHYHPMPNYPGKYLGKCGKRVWPFPSEPSDVDQGWLFNSDFKEPHPIFRNRHVGYIVQPWAMLSYDGNKLDMGHKLVLWLSLYYRDFDSNTTIVDYAQYGKFWNKDPSNIRRSVEKLIKLEWYFPFKLERGYAIVQFARQMFWPNQYRALRDLCLSDPSGPRLLLPVIEQVQEDLRFRSQRLVGSARRAQMVLIYPEPGQGESGASEHAAPIPPEPGQGESGASEHAAPIPPEPGQGEPGASEHAAPIPPEHGATEKRQSGSTGTQEAAIRAKLAQLAANEASPARELRKDLKTFEDSKTFERRFSGLHPARALGLKDLGKADHEDPKTEDLATRVLVRERDIIDALRYPNSILNWMFASLAAMCEGVALPWNFGSGPITFDETDQKKLADIIQRANEKPEYLDPMNPELGTAKRYFIGSVARLIADILEPQEMRAKQIVQDKRFWKVPKLHREALKQIGYPWQQDVMSKHHNPTNPEHRRRFERLATKGG